MDFKKGMLLLLLILGMASCSSDTQDGSTKPEIVYADVKPTQTKYKAFYGERIVKIKGSGTSRPNNADPSPQPIPDVVKPVSVIYYPLTQTISFSNIFENTRVEYKVTAITVNKGISVIYSFKIGETVYTCKIIEKTFISPATVTVYFAGGSYQFNVTSSEKMKIAKLLSKQTNTSTANSKRNYTIQYTYKDTLVVKSVRNYNDSKTGVAMVQVSDFVYNGAKIASKTLSNGEGAILKKVTYSYENNLITKATTTDPAGNVTIDTYEYDAQGRLITTHYGNSSGTIFYMIRHYIYEKNKMTTIYTDDKESYYDTEISVYNSDRKPYLITQDQILDPFYYLDITTTSITHENGTVDDFPKNAYEYSEEGLLIKVSKSIDPANPDVLIREYEEE
ncbi:RHS repeat domain-containing protein [Flavobacterium pectinovorum]|nr:RHS repeat domain-containing protein [Flavobacterium pectinovorum]